MISLQLNKTPYKTYEEKMSFNFYKKNKTDANQIQIFKEGTKLPILHFYNPHERGMFYINRNLITNNFMYGIALFDEVLSFYNEFYSIEFNGSPEMNFHKLATSNTILKSDAKVNESNKLSPKRDFKNAWPVSISSTNFWYVFQMISHNSFQHRTFYIPPGKTIVFKTIKSIEFVWGQSVGEKEVEYWPVITYNVMSITANKQTNQSHYITNLFHITSQDKREWKNKTMPIDYSFSFQNDVHSTKVENLNLGEKKEMELGLSSQGIQKIFEKNKTTFLGDFEIKGSTKYNYKTDQTIIDYSNQSKKGYLVPYSFSGTMHPKAHFSFNDNLEDIYLVTDIDVPTPYLNNDWGQVQVAINHEKKLKEYSNKFFIPEHEIDLLFKEKELNDSTFQRWRK